ncbi:MAG: glycosyltransferase 61 family protein [Candidatus Fonsibacter ubiquis]|jgi:capsular polysaccharide biosynthesis protein
MFTTYPKNRDNVFLLTSKDKTFFENEIKGESYSNSISVTGEIANKKIISEYLDDRFKIILNYNNAFGHCLHDFLGTLLYEDKNNKKNNRDCLFIIHASNMYNNNLNKFMINLLKNLNINYEIISLKDDEIFSISNFKYWKTGAMIYEGILEIDKVLNNFYSKNQATKKVYVSRSAMQGQKNDYQLFHENNKEDFMFFDDIRVDNENILEQYFKSLNFEIVYPETFKSFEDQLLYFSEAKTLVGLTGAGLWNGLFMPRGSKIFELTTPLATHGVEYIHNYYKCLGFAKNHKYIAINNMRIANDIIDSIEKDISLRSYISE